MCVSTTGRGEGVRVCVTLVMFMCACVFWDEISRLRSTPPPFLSHEAFRQRVTVGRDPRTGEPRVPEPLLAQLLSTLRGELAALAPADMLPPALLLGNRPPRARAGKHAAGRGGDEDEDEDDMGGAGGGAAGAVDENKLPTPPQTFALHAVGAELLARYFPLPHAASPPVHTAAEPAAQSPPAAAAAPAGAVPADWPLARNPLVVMVRPEPAFEGGHAGDPDEAHYAFYSGFGGSDFAPQLAVKVTLRRRGAGGRPIPSTTLRACAAADAAMSLLAESEASAGEGAAAAGGAGALTMASLVTRALRFAGEAGASVSDGEVRQSVVTAVEQLVAVLVHVGYLRAPAAVPTAPS